MIDKLDAINLGLTRLKDLDNNKFCSFNFGEVNEQLEFALKQIISSINTGDKKTLSIDEQVSLKKLISKIEKIEPKIIPKANLLNSFSKSIT